MTGYSPEFKIACRLGYARDLFKARSSEEGKPPKFGANLIIWKSDTAAIALLKQNAEIAAREEWKGKTDQMVKDDLLKSPLLDGDGKQGINKKTGERRPELVNGLFIRSTATLNRPPKLFGRAFPLMPAVEGTDLYSGCYVEAVINAWTWSHPTNGNGISFNLAMMRMVRDGEKLAGGYEADPEEYFGKIEDAGAAPASTQNAGAAGLFA